MEKPSGKNLQKKKTIPADVKVVWDKWTTSEGLLSFFGPKNKIEFKIGGAYEIYFLLDNPPGTQGGEGNKIISYLPYKMFSFSWNAPPQFEYIRNHKHQTWVVLNFKELNKDRTEIELNHIGWLEGEQWDEVYDYFDQAWTRVLDWLEESVL